MIKKNKEFKPSQRLETVLEQLETIAIFEKKEPAQKRKKKKETKT
jgi:hypothetical protein